ncbi:hypothetical protein NMY22_g14597 [Coprinellus aureogranulatus]|nr:hypothetical protein NMY22_g14597 [Coprinellus aureogranulatus]
MITVPMNRLFQSGSRPSSAFSILPQELVHMVVDRLMDDDDLDSLRTVALVSSPWYARTREHLFTYIHITHWHDTTIEQCTSRVEGLQKLLALAANPFLARCVTHLCLYNLSQGWFDGTFEHFGRTLADLLSNLTLLTHLWITGETERSQLTWGGLPKQVQSALYTLISAPIFYHLTLEYVGDIDLLPFIQLPNIKELEVSHSGKDPSAGSTILRSKTTATPSRKEMPQSLYNIQRLAVYDCGRMLLNFLQSYSLQLRPKAFTIIAAPWDDDTDLAFPILLNTLAGSVEAYTIEQDSYDPIEDELNTPMPSCVFAFERFPNMKHLTIITLAKFFTSRSDLDPFPMILDQLDRTPQAASKLERLKFEFDFSSLDEPLTLRPLDFVIRMKDALSRLDSILSRPSFRHLRGLSLSFNCTCQPVSGPEWEGMKIAILAGMEGLRERKMVPVAINWLVTASTVAQVVPTLAKCRDSLASNTIGVGGGVSVSSTIARQETRSKESIIRNG